MKHILFFIMLSILNFSCENYTTSYGDHQEYDEINAGSISSNKEKKKKIKFSNYGKPLCLCNKELVLIQGNSYIDAIKINCDICYKFILFKNPKVKYWHCKKGYSKEHKNGFDICKKCVENKK